VAVAGRIVALRALGLGDLLTAVPALRALRRAHPEHRLQLATPAALTPLAEVARCADEVVDTDLRNAGRPAPERPLDGALRRPDLAVNLHGTGPQTHRLLRALEPGRLVAFANAEAGVDGPAWTDDEHEVARWCRLVREAGVPADETDLDIDPAGLPAPPPVAEGATLLHPGAASRARRWPEGRWVALAQAEVTEGRGVVLTGSSAEADLARRIAADAGLPREAVLAGRTDVLGLAAAVAGAERVVCGDTGVAHLATALGTPSVVLFGPVAPTRWGPPPERPQHRALWSGRSGDPHARCLDAGLAEIAVADVRAALAALPARATRTMT
jgi:ADP-heptose:LPS heptosyltransferase